MRTTCSRSNTKILPSPILPVFADFSIASITCSSSSVLIAASIFTLGRKSTTYSAPRYSSVWPFCRPKPLTSVTVIPCTPIADRASRTSSSLNGLMIAVTSFIWMLPELGDFPRGVLELVDRLDSHRIHGFAQRSATVVEEVIACLVGPELAADLRVLGWQIGKRYCAFGVFRVGWAAKVEAVGVLEPLDTTRDPPCVFEHVGHVTGKARVFGVGTARPPGFILLDVYVLAPEGQGVGHRPGGDDVDQRFAGGRRRSSRFRAEVADDIDCQRLDRGQPDTEFDGLLPVVILHLIPAVVHPARQAHLVVDRIRGAHTGVGEGNRAKQNRARDIVVAGAGNDLGSRQRDEFPADDGQRPGRILDIGLGHVEPGRIRISDRI